jgi:hypothetical protein
MNMTLEEQIEEIKRQQQEDPKVVEERRLSEYRHYENVCYSLYSQIVNKESELTIYQNSCGANYSHIVDKERELTILREQYRSAEYNVIIRRQYKDSQ